ncbi:12998_t:CDS:2 [Rhizophagus irregularis]|nr:12998_t:CDS:2 [Rhizophagus irregularis]
MSEKENTTTGGTCCRDIEHLRRPSVSNKGRSEQLETESGHFSISNLLWRDLFTNRLNTQLPKYLDPYATAINAQYSLVTRWNCGHIHPVIDGGAILVTGPNDWAM